jgi:hypothetical protein
MESHGQLHSAKVGGQVSSRFGDLLYQKFPDLPAESGDILIFYFAQICVVVYPAK